MSAMSRRGMLREVLGGLLGVAGAAVIARAVLEPAAAEAAPADGDVQRRADQVAAEVGTAPEGDGTELTAFVNGGFRNGGGGGGFRKGAFANGGGGGGGFKNGAFANGGGGGGGFKNGGFANGGGGGGFRNGAFRNF